MKQLYYHKFFIIWLLLCLSGLLIFPACIKKENNQTQPNILFIAIDDLNDWIGCLDGYPGLKTPNIDLLAERGVLFTNAIAQHQDAMHPEPPL